MSWTQARIKVQVKFPFHLNNFRKRKKKVFNVRQSQLRVQAKPWVIIKGVRHLFLLIFSQKTFGIAIKYSKIQYTTETHGNSL